MGGTPQDSSLLTPLDCLLIQNQGFGRPLHPPCATRQIDVLHTDLGWFPHLERDLKRTPLVVVTADVPELRPRYGSRAQRLAD